LESRYRFFWPRNKSTDRLIEKSEDIVFPLTNGRVHKVVPISMWFTDCWIDFQHMRLAKAWPGTMEKSFAA
jgi:hypothetical protein